MSHYSSTDVVEQNSSGHWPVGGHSRPRMLAANDKCNCCPYGYHIDLGFVQYAEDVSNGNLQDHLKQVRQAKRKMRQSLDSYQQKQRQTNGVGLRSPDEQYTPSPNERSGAFSPMESVFSDSLENLMSDFEETCTTHNVARPPRRPADYSSDFERSISSPLIGRRAGIRTDGYQSDYGYAVPAQLKRHQNGYHPPPKPAISSITRPTRLSLSAERPVMSPSLVDRTGSLSSVSSLTASSKYATSGATTPNYRTSLSGQIARNMDSLANQLPREQSLSPQPRPYSSTVLKNAMFGSRSNRSMPLRPASASSNDSSTFERRQDDVLRSVRNQMVGSLQHNMDEIHDQVHGIPVLNDRIKNLKQKNEQLARDLEEERLRQEQRFYKKPTPPPVPPKTKSPIGPRPPLPEVIVEEKKSEYSTAVAKAMNEAKTMTLERNIDQPLAKHHSPPAEPEPPAPPPPPKRDDSAVRLPPLVRTPSGNLINMEGFHSVRRRYSDVPGQKRPNSVDDYASDSELSLGDRSFERFSSLRRSRTMLQSGTPNAGDWSADAYTSDTEEYNIPRSRRQYSINSSAVCRPRALSSSISTDQSSSNDLGSTEFFRDQVTKWREQFQQLAPTTPTIGSVQSVTSQQSKPTTPSTPPIVPQKPLTFRKAFSPSTPPIVVQKEMPIQASSPIPPPVIQNVLPSVPFSTPKRDYGMVTDPPPSKLSIGVNVNIEPATQKSQARLEIKSGPCSHCEARKKIIRNSVGTGTAPTPAPKPSQGCIDCKKLRAELNELISRKMTFTKETFTEGSQEISLPSIGAMTDEKELCSFGVMVDIPEPRPETNNIETNTETIQHEHFEIGVGTDNVQYQDQITETEIITRNTVETATDVNQFAQIGSIREVSIGTEQQFSNTIAIGTDQSITGCSFCVGHKLDQSSMTELDLDALLAELKTTNDKPLCVTSGVNTDFTAVADAACGPVDRMFLIDAKTNTEYVDLVERSMSTEAVEVRQVVERHGVSAQTEKTPWKNVYVNTDAAKTNNRGTTMAFRTREIGTSPVRHLFAESTSSIITETKETKDAEIQTEMDEPRTLEPRSEEEEGDVLWLMPQQAQVPTVSTACGDDDVHGTVCEHCLRLQYSFTRNVGVGNCAVSDRVCVSCDDDNDIQFGQQTVSSVYVDEREAPGLSYETSPAFVRKEEKRSSLTKRKSTEEVMQKSTDSSHSLSAVEDHRTEIEVAGESPEEFDEVEDEYEEETKSPTPVPPPRRKVDLTKPRATRAFELSRAAATKKLLLTDQKQGLNRNSFKRGTVASKSMRMESKKGDSLVYITDKKSSPQSKTKNGKETPPPSVKKGEGLKGKVTIKKEIPKPPMKSPPPPIPAKIPRPKYSKYPSPEPKTSGNHSPEEVAEAQDRLTPLRSEMIHSWPGSPVLSRGNNKPVQYQPPAAGYENHGLVDDKNDTVPSPDGKMVGKIMDNLPPKGSDESSSDSDTDSLDEGSYDTSGRISGTCDIEDDSSGSSKMTQQSQVFELTAPLTEACDYLNKQLTGKSIADVPEEKMVWSQQYLQHEWLKAAARRHANAHFVEAFLDALENHSKELLHKVVNMSDLNENTALHYAVSHGNFDVVSLLLDSKVAELNRPNKAGYTPIMLAALCPVTDETETMVIQRLFQMGDVNGKASQHGQTALMLAVSHGKLETAKLLVSAGADLNIRDEDGSTALMCAAEHGHKDVVKFILAQPEVDASLTDYDGSTALSIAVENGHRDVGVLIYAHLNYGRGVTPTTTNSKSILSPSSPSPPSDGVSAQSSS